MNARNGKIARLPRHVRDELNERLECSEESPELLAWLNGLKEVKKILAKDFDGAPINKQNLTLWRKGGFQEWLGRRDLCEAAGDVAELAQEMGDENSVAAVADHAAVVLAARLGTLLANWNGEVDERFKARVQVLERIGRTVVQLQRSMHRADLESLELTVKLAAKEKADNEVLKDQLTDPFFDALKVGPLAAQLGGGEAGRKIARFILAVQRGRLDAKLDLSPTDKFDRPTPPEPVKPARKKPTCKRVRKTSRRNESKPLEENEMDGAKNEDARPAESGWVKVDQACSERAPLDTATGGGGEDCPGARPSSGAAV